MNTTRRPFRRGPRRLGATRLVILLAVGALVAACAGGGDNGGQTNEGAETTSTETTSTETSAGATSADAGLEAFCGEAERLEGTMPESYVGSEQHLADATALADTAPDAIRPQVETFRDYIASEVDPDAPASQLTQNQPPEVSRAVAEIMNFLAQNC